MEHLDGLCRAAVSRSINLAVPWFLCTSILYYRQNVSVISDDTFDTLCKDLLAHWPTVSHPHKHFITEDDLRAGSGFALPYNQLPQRIYYAAEALKKKAGL